MKAAVSLSVVVTVTVWLATLSKLSSLSLSTTAIVTVVCVSTSITLSSTPVKVTVCALFQLPFVNVRVPEDTVTSPVSADVTLITTSLSGCAFNTTV